MKIDVTTGLSVLAAYAKGLNFGVAPPPLSEQEIARRQARGQPLLCSWSGGGSYAIPSRARHQQAAWEFIRYLAGEHAIRVHARVDQDLAESLGHVYIPGQQPQQAINSAFFREFIAGNAKLAPKFKAAYRVFNDLLPYSHFRPVTPVGQLLWNEQLNAMENALYQQRTGMTPAQALTMGTANVQQELNRFLTPPRGYHIRSWNWFFLLYAVLILLTGTLVFLWDTRPGFRRMAARLFGLPRLADKAMPAGAHGRRLQRNWWEGMAAALPWLIGFLIFGGGPMLFSLIISFTDFDVLRPPVFTGTQNYQTMLHDPLLGVSLRNTVFMMIGVPLGMAVGLAIAILLNQQLRGIAVWRTFFYLPSIVPTVAASVLWIWILNPQGGLLNGLLAHAGLTKLPDWLQNPDWSKPSLVLMNLWGAGGSMIIWLAGLKAIPQGTLRSRQCRRREWLAAVPAHHRTAIIPLHFF